nr:immunoglobulin heavy chain junction region [Mus musculus]
LCKLWLRRLLVLRCL